MAKSVVSTRLGVACKAASSFVTFVVLTTRFGCQIVEMSRLLAQRSLRPENVICHVLEILIRPVAALLVLAFGKILIFHAKLIPPLLQTWANGHSRDATGMHIPFAFLFGRGTSDGCVRFVNSDSNTVRALTVQILGVYQKFRNSAEFCVSMCENSGYSVAGMEFALECRTCRLFDELSSPDQLRS